MSKTPGPEDVDCTWIVVRLCGQKTNPSIFLMPPQSSLPAASPPHPSLLCLLTLILLLAVCYSPQTPALALNEIPVSLAGIPWALQHILWLVDCPPLTVPIHMNCTRS